MPGRVLLASQCWPEAPYASAHARLPRPDANACAKLVGAGGASGSTSGAGAAATSAGPPAPTSRSPCAAATAGGDTGISGAENPAGGWEKREGESAGLDTNGPGGPARLGTPVPSPRPPAGTAGAGKEPSMAGTGLGTSTVAWETSAAICSWAKVHRRRASGAVSSLPGMQTAG
jgi:hypothetical protein